MKFKQRTDLEASVQPAQAVSKNINYSGGFSSPRIELIRDMPPVKPPVAGNLPKKVPTGVGKDLAWSKENSLENKHLPKSAPVNQYHIWPYPR